MLKRKVAEVSVIKLITQKRLDDPADTKLLQIQFPPPRPFLKITVEVNI